MSSREVCFSDLPGWKVERLLAAGRVDFDFAALDNATEGQTAAVAGAALAVILSGLVGVEWPKAGGNFASRAAGRRLLILHWVMHPDQMPWAPGQPQSAREVADALGIHKNRVAKVAAEFTRAFGISNAYQRHGSNRRGGKGGQAIEEETGSPIGGGKG